MFLTLIYWTQALLCFHVHQYRWTVGWCFGLVCFAYKSKGLFLADALWSSWMSSASMHLHQDQADGAAS